MSANKAEALERENWIYKYSKIMTEVLTAGMFFLFISGLLEVAEIYDGLEEVSLSATAFGCFCIFTCVSFCRSLINSIKAALENTHKKLLNR